MVSFTPRPLHPWGKLHTTHWIGCLMNPGADLDAMPLWGILSMVAVLPNHGHKTCWAMPAPQSPKCLGVWHNVCDPYTRKPTKSQGQICLYSLNHLKVASSHQYATITPNSMGLITSWEATSRSAGQIPSILWNPKVHYLVYKSPPLVLILSRMNSINTIRRSSLRSILRLSYLSLDLPGGLFPSGSPTKTLYEFPFVPIHAICPACHTRFESRRPCERKIVCIQPYLQ
jgi:hypothetical protein